MREVIKRTVIGELWLPVPDWPYEVSSLGHVRRRRGKLEVEQRLDREGYTVVTLRRGTREYETHLDSLIGSVFTGRPLSDQRPLHIDGLPWNNWPSNLNWGLGVPLDNMENLVTHWSVMNGGKLQHGGYTNKDAAWAAAQHVGDVIIGRNPKRVIVSYEINISRSRDMSPVNPFDLANKFEALANSNRNQFWSFDMEEAAIAIRVLATENLKLNSSGSPIAQTRSEQLGLDEDILPSEEEPPEEVELPIRPRTATRSRTMPVRRTLTPPAPAKRTRRAL